MARTLHKLTSRQVETINKAGRYSDGGGLYLRITPKGTRRWVFRYTPNKGAKPRELGFGSAAKEGVSLAQARELASQAREAMFQGQQPLSLRDSRVCSYKINQPTFGEFADQYIAIQSTAFRNEKHIAQWKMTLAVYAEPIRRKGLDQITTDDVLAILHPLWQAKTETASRLRGRIEKVLDAAKAQGLRSGENPARWRGHLALLLPKPNRLERSHHQAMAYQDIPQFVSTLRQHQTMSSLALEFLILSAARSGEIRAMQWKEIDEELGVWIIPALRMKSGRVHRVPLTQRMTTILNLVKPWSQSSQYVFPNQRGHKPLSDSAMSKVLKALDAGNNTVHGFRSSFRDWAGDETDFPRELAEEALSHVIGSSTERAYRRSDAFIKRARMMQAWEDFVLGKTEHNL